MDKKSQPIFNRVLVKQEAATEEKRGNIIIPEIVMDAQPLAFGNVLSIGHKCEVVKEGDRVLYPKSIGTPVKVKDEDCLLIIENDILMID